MGLALDIFGPAALVAGLTSLVVVAFGQSAFGGLPARVREQYLLPAALAAAFFAGYLALPRSWAAVIPQPGQAWHWLPYLGVIAAAVGGLTAGRHAALRWIALVGLSLIAGWLLTPTWPLFGLPWPASITILSVYLFSSIAALALWPPRSFVAPFLGLLALVAVVVAACVAAVISIRFAQLAALAAAGLAGCSLAGFVSKPAEHSLRSLAPIFAVLVGGIAFMACVEPERPVVALLVLPALPLAASPFVRRTIG